MRVAILEDDTGEEWRCQALRSAKETVETLIADESAHFRVLIRQHKDKAAHQLQIALVVERALKEDVVEEGTGRHHGNQRCYGLNCSNANNLLVLHVAALAN